MSFKAWLRATILVTSVALLPSSAGALAQANSSAAVDVPHYVGQLIRSLNDGSAAQPRRTEAARRLLEVGTPDAREAITDGLKSTDRRVQLASADAIATAESPDPAWIPPLADLLGRGTATEAAARALAHYDTNAAAYMPLVRYVQPQQPPPPNRAVVIAAMGQIVQKAVAQALVERVTDPSEAADVRTTAEAALGQLSGQADIGQDAAAWLQWWNTLGGRPPADWRTAVIAEQHAYLQSASERSAQALRQLMEQVRTLLLDEYQRQPQADKPRVLIGYLNNPDASIREIGAQIVPVAFGGGQPMSDAIRARLIELIGDATPQVRLRAIEALTALADANALGAIFVQLRIEKDPKVKVALVQAIARTPDPRALGTLEGLLRDPSLPTAIAAADALHAMGPAIQSNPAQASQVSTALMQAMQRRTGPPGQPTAQPGADELRAALVGALAPLAASNDPGQMLNLFSDLLGQNESRGVRQAALQGLAALRDKGASIIVHELDPIAEPDPRVREAAANALADTGLFGFTDQLDSASNNEPVPAVRDAEWKAFQRLLPAGSPHELVDWANRFERNQNYEKQVAVLNAAVNKKQDPASIAQEQQTIGDIYFSHLHQPEKSIPFFTQALSYWQNNNARSSTVVVLVQQLMNAYLSTRQYTNAIAFAQSQLKVDRAREENLWGPLSNAATRLMNGTPEDRAAGRTLIEGALAMDPPLNPGYQQALRELLSSPMQP